MPRRKQTMAERARAVHAAEPELSVVEIQHRIGANSYQQVQNALGRGEEKRGRRRNTIKVQLKPDQVEQLEAVAAAAGKPIEKWAAAVLLAAAKKRHRG